MNIKNKVLYNEIRTLSGYSLDLETLCLRVSGDDSSKFLQGQLSNDINLIDDNNYQISSYSTNQGKVISINRIFKDNHSYIILLNKDIAEYFVEKISMYILVLIKILILSILKYIFAKRNAICQDIIS